MLTIACNSYNKDINSTNSSNYSIIDSLIASISKDTIALEKYLDLAITTGDVYAEMMVYNEMGQYHFNNYNFSKAIFNYEKYLETAFSNNDTIHTIKALNKIASNYRKISAYSESANYYFKAMSLLYQVPNVISNELISEKYNTLYGLGNIYLNLNITDEALTYLRGALELAYINNEIERQAESYELIGSTLEIMMDYDSAYLYYNNSLELYISCNSVSGMSTCFNRIGNLYLIKGEYEAASVYLESAYYTLKNTSDKMNWLEACLSLGNLNIKMSKLSTAEKYLNEGLEFSKELNLPFYLEKVYLLLSEFHKKEGRILLALDKHILSDQYSESYSGKMDLDRIMHLRLNFEEEINEAEKYALNLQYMILEKEKQRVIFISLITIISLIALLVLLIQNQKIKIKKKEAILKLEKDKTDFCISITQEFKTPVSIVIGLIDRLKKDIDPSKEKKNILDLEILSRQSENLKLLIDGISSIANLVDNKKQNKVIHGNIVAYMQYLYECYSVLAEVKKINYIFHSNVSELCVDYIPDYIRIIISSLVSNVISYCTENDSINISINLDKNNKYFTIEVSDSGLRPDFNEMPFTFDSYINKQPELSITKQLVEKLHGKIEVKNNIDGYNVFRIRFSIQNENVNKNNNSITINKVSIKSNTTEINEFDSIKNRDKPIVLIIIDNRDMNYYLSTILKDKYNVFIELNIEAGISVANKKIPDIIISDNSLPNNSCNNLCHEIRSSSVTSHIPIILLTVNNSKEERIEGIKSGADAFLIKPVYETELKAVIERLLSLRKQINDKYSSLKQYNLISEENHTDSEVNFDFLNRVTNIIYRDITNSENIIEIIASEICLSSSQLNRKIKAITGLTTTNFILKTRLNRARKLLTITQRQIGDIAMECGFKDFAYFSRSFKKEFGITPTTFQRLPNSVN